MPRRAAIIPNRKLTTTLPPELLDQLDEFLFSSVEGRVPQGAYQKWISERIREFFSREYLDLGPHLAELPDYHLVYGRADTIAALSVLLNKESCLCKAPCATQKSTVKP